MFLPQFLDRLCKSIQRRLRTKLANGAPYQLQCGLKIVSRSQRVRLFVYTCDLPRAFLLQQKLFCGVEESCECRFARELRESRTPYPDSFFVIGFLDCFLERRCSA